ncbi:MAG: UDP-3-O-(3-hydroxymyristoyl)glucosamine N-acyltransferase [Betaproteobacteria bacterium]|nr:UDP-3-O-(3-hydroxymyristoyl)glucosamine N-acyltransferase [Betaproteobacteria bacterium]
MVQKGSDAACRLGDIVDRFGGELLGPRDLVIRQVAPLDSARADEISFLTASKYRKLLSITQAGAVILGPDDRESTDRPRIVSTNPYVYLARVSGLLNPPRLPRPGVHASAVVADGARVAASASVGPCAVVEADAVIGEGAVIGPGSVVGARSQIGDATVLNANVVVYHDCRVGSRCILHSGVVIGGDGFGMAEDDGRWLKVPQIGGVVVGDDVEIGANTTVDRGALGDTVIEDGVKLDNQIQVGHNVVIGAHTAVAACAGFAGSTRIGRRCKIGGAAMIHGHIELCDGAVVAAGTMVRKSIAEPGLYDGFFPALPHKDWMKNLANFNRLHELADTVRDLATRLEALEKDNKT